MRQLCVVFVLVVCAASCSVQKKLHRSAEQTILAEPALQAAHVGISIYDPATNKYLYNYQGDKYFVPASNIKIPTCYAAMKYLGDSLVGLRYGVSEGDGLKNAVVIDATGDPSFLHSDYNKQPIFDSLVRWYHLENRRAGYLIKDNKIDRWGSGWSWNDFDAAYMAERSTLPVFGNVINVRLLDTSLRRVTQNDYPHLTKYNLFYSEAKLFDSLLNNTKSPLSYLSKQPSPKITIERDIATNKFSIKSGSSIFRSQLIPFVTNDFYTALQVIADTLNIKFALSVKENKLNRYSWSSDDGDISHVTIKKWHKIHSQPTDSLLKPMMHRSDNFFAEQSLLMVSNEMLGVMNDAKIIDTILKTDFKDLPQKPRWVDGSGLSRYNLFTPQSFVAILKKMKNEFGMERIKEIFPTGGEGTLNSLYKTDSGYIYAKTGTLSGVVALSGFIYTQKGKLLLFSVLVNNHQGSATPVRKAVERFLQGVRKEY